MAAMSVAYWLNPYGQILELPVKDHISAIISQPEKFGLTKEYVTGLYAKFGEPVGVEGKAREQIIREVVSAGFIRIRLYRQFWSVTVNRLDNKTKKALSNWAEVAKENKQAGKYHPVKILELATDKQSTFDVNTIYYDFTESADSSLQWVNNLSEFHIFKPSFKQFILNS